MSAMDTPWVFAVDVEAALVEWALNTSVSTPASFSSSFIHWAIEADVNGLCGFWNEIRRGTGPIGSTALNMVVFLHKPSVSPLGKVLHHLWIWQRKLPLVAWSVSSSLSQVYERLLLLGVNCLNCSAWRSEDLLALPRANTTTSLLDSSLSGKSVSCDCDWMCLFTTPTLKPTNNEVLVASGWTYPAIICRPMDVQLGGLQ